ncbi:MAG: menaquinol-cytochrome c reductase iron-sulfur subunit [Acidobacteriota bacterium]|nr:menaquinol-cytochrome c reductase iron-sulfur subunit [Acidobacteriota bacterium]
MPRHFFDKMNDKSKNIPDDIQDMHAPDDAQDWPAPTHSRRRILFWIPAAALASIFGTVAFAAFKFIRPVPGVVGIGLSSGGDWFPVAKLSELSNAEPLRREVIVEHRAGWSVTPREHAVYVMPDRRVLSAVCPHEGCEVDWSAEQREFLCPCHDSVFSADGARLRGPARSDLAQLPARTNGDTLELHYGDDANATPHTDSNANG